VGNARVQMIELRLCRIGHCERCKGRMVILTEGYTPPKCVHCGAEDWIYGKESIEGIRIRTGMTFAPKHPDGRRIRGKGPGQSPKSLKRRERARRQGQSFGVKGVDGPAGT
jgi:hypothetical protein